MKPDHTSKMEDGYETMRKQTLPDFVDYSKYTRKRQNEKLRAIVAQPLVALHGTALDPWVGMNKREWTYVQNPTWSAAVLIFHCRTQAYNELRPIHYYEDQLVLDPHWGVLVMPTNPTNKETHNG